MQHVKQVILRRVAIKRNVWAINRGHAMMQVICNVIDCNFRTSACNQVDKKM